MPISYGISYTHNHFHSQTQAKSRQLRTELRIFTLDNCSVDEFLTQIKEISDSLCSIGDAVTLKE